MAAARKQDTTRDLVDSPSSSIVPTSIHELLWEDRSRTLREFVSSYRLPLVVKLKSGDISKFLNVYNVSTNKGTNSPTNSTSVSNYSTNCAGQIRVNTSLDLISTAPGAASDSKESESRMIGLGDVILQIHEVRKRKIILARKMTWDKRQSDYVVTGEQVEIPASVKGWLEVIPEDGRPVEYFDTIGGITNIKPKRFLVRTSTVGYQLTTEDNGNSCWMPQEIKPGEVLSTGIVYIDSKKNNNSAHRNIFQRLLKQKKTKKEIEPDLKYLQCFDLSGTEIMIPLIMSGIFSPVGDSSYANHDAVYEFQDLIMAFGLPVNAQIIHVSAKEHFQYPRGVVRLYGTREEELAIVSKVGADGNLFRAGPNVETFEIPLDSDALFSRGVMKKRSNVNSSAVFCPNEPKLLSKNKSLDRETPVKEHVMNMQMATFNETPYQRAALSLNERRKSATAIYQSPTATAIYQSPTATAIYQSPNSSSTLHSNDTDINSNKVIQHGTLKANAAPTYSTSYSVEPNTQVLPKHPDSFPPKSAEQSLSSDVELPEKAPREAKSRSGSILEKLSVRKVQKERARLKELRSDDVFSRRISRSELSYQDFFSGLGEDGEDAKSSEYARSKQDDSGRGSSGGTYQSTSSTNSSSAYSTTTVSTPSKTGFKSPDDVDKATQRRASIQKRDLPPIPIDSPRNSDPATPHHSIDASNESLYEHLPPAPHPPHSRRSSDSALLEKHNDVIIVDDEKDDEDGYMMPKQIQLESRYVKRSNVQARHKSPGRSKDSSRSTKTRKARSEASDEYTQRSTGNGSSCPLDIDHLFGFTYSSKDFADGRPVGDALGPGYVSASQAYGSSKVPEWRSKITGQVVEQSFLDNLNIDTPAAQRGSRHRSRLAKNMNANPNATLRSHNLRKMRMNAKDVFPFHDTSHDSQHTHYNFSDFQDNGHRQIPCEQQNIYARRDSRPQMLNSHSMDAALMAHQREQFQNFPGSSYGVHYVESEPGFRRNNRAFSVDGLGDAFFKHGDDSAISVCSRGEAGYPNEGDDTYNVYLERTSIPDDGWTPPDQIGELSVHEVSRSLRYIGMKDRVVLRFSKEQIDGSMLCTLDEKLLKEGFPELNALEVKKIMDFIRGWRPKKS